VLCIDSPCAVHCHSTCCALTVHALCIASPCAVHGRLICFRDGLPVGHSGAKHCKGQQANRRSCAVHCRHAQYTPPSTCVAFGMDGMHPLLVPKSFAAPSPSLRVQVPRLYLPSPSLRVQVPRLYMPSPSLSRVHR